MTKITLNPVGSLIDATTASTTINQNSVIVQNAFDNTLSRDGTSPNQMNATLDMNSNRIINLPAPTGSLDPVRLADVSALASGGTINTLPLGGTASQVLTKNSGTNYDVSWQTSSVAGAPNPAFGGRLTISSGNPVMSADVTGSQTLYYAPYTGKTVPTYTGGVWTTRNFTANSTDQVGLSLSLAGSVNWAANTLHDVFAVMDSGTLKIGTRLWDAGMLSTETLITPNVTITTGTTPLAWTNPGGAFDGTTSKTSAGSIAQLGSPSNNSEANYLGQDWGAGVTKTISKVVVYACTDSSILGNAPSVEGFYVYGSNDNVNWHLITVWRGNDNGVAGTVFTIPISQTETQAYRYHRVGFDGNGINALRVAQIQFFNKVAPANGRRLTHNDGVLVNDASMTIRTGASTTITTAQFEGIYLGTIHIDTATNGQLSATLTYGPSRTYGVWNYYNRVPLKLMAGTYATSKFYTPVTTQLWNVCESAFSGNSFSIEVLSGYPEEPISAELPRSVALNTLTPGANASYECAIGVDTTLNFSGQEGSCNIDNSGSPGGGAMGFIPRASLRITPFAGLKTFYGLERQGNSGTGGQSSFTGPRSTHLAVEWNA